MSKTSLGDGDAALVSALPAYLCRSRWFGGKARPICNVRIVDQATIAPANRLLFLEVEYAEGDPEVYLLPIKLTSQSDDPRSVIATVDSGHLVDSSSTDSFRAALAHLISGETQWSTANGRIVAEHGTAFQDKPGPTKLPSRTLGVEQSNTSVVFGDRFFCKLYRKVEEGENPDLEVTRYLTEKKNFPHVPPYVAALMNGADTLRRYSAWSNF